MIFLSTHTPWYFCGGSIQGNEPSFRARVIHIWICVFWYCAGEHYNYKYRGIRELFIYRGNITRWCFSWAGVFISCARVNLPPKTMRRTPLVPLCPLPVSKIRTPPSLWFSRLFIHSFPTRIFLALIFSKSDWNIFGVLYGIYFYYYSFTLFSQLCWSRLKTALL